MTDLPPIQRILEPEMRQKFNDGKFWDRVKSGDLKEIVTDSRHPSLMAANEPHCTYSQQVSYRDADNNEVARVHQYIRPSGEIGASGLPDPKRVLIDGVLYRLVKKKDRTTTDQV